MDIKRLKLYGHQPCVLRSSIDSSTAAEWKCPQCGETYVSDCKAYCPDCKESEKSMRDRRLLMKKKVEFLHAEIAEINSDIEVLSLALKENYK
jgi:hypothetical protein